MRRIEVGIVINRPIDDVFEFVSDPENVRLWQSGVLESRQTSEGPMGVGATYLEVRQSLGRRMESNSEVTRYERNAKLGSSTSEPVPFEAEYTFEAAPGGTKLTLAARMELGGLFKLTEPILMWLFRADMQGAFDTLKDILEAQA